MKLKRMVISLILLSTLAATFLGCNKNEDRPEEYDSEDYAITGNSSSGTVIEVQDGIYRLAENIGSYIMYADKSDLSNWVYLCNKPTCKHDGWDCYAYIGI